MIGNGQSAFKTVLLVDDEPDNVEVIEDAIEFGGLAVKSAGNGQQALEVLKEFKPDLILLDLSMPVMDGWETRKRIQENPDTRNIPVVALTAHAMVGDKERVLGAGFSGYVAKPINVATFVQDVYATLAENAKQAAPPANEAADETNQQPTPQTTETVDTKQQLESMS